VHHSLAGVLSTVGPQVETGVGLVLVGEPVPQSAQSLVCMLPLQLGHGEPILRVAVGSPAPRLGLGARSPGGVFDAPPDRLAPRRALGEGLGARDAKAPLGPGVGLRGS